MAWRYVVDCLKGSLLVCRLADQLARSRGRLRPLGGFLPPPPPPKPDLSRFSDHHHPLAVAWLGHATCLIRLGTSVFLTDPIFASRVGLGLGPLCLGPRRKLAPALSLAELPNLAGVLITHAHLDHLDRPTLHRLARLQPNLPILTAPATRDLLDDLGFTSITEIHIGQAVELASTLITATPVNHWGARSFRDTHRGYCGYLLQSAGKRVYFAPDAAAPDEPLAAQMKQLAPVDLAIVGIGAYQPYERAHATPEQAVAMARLLQPKAIAAIHHSTFQLSEEPMDEPLQRFNAAIGNEKPAIRQVGDVYKA